MPNRCDPILWMIGMVLAIQTVGCQAPGGEGFQSGEKSEKERQARSLEAEQLLAKANASFAKENDNQAGKLLKKAIGLDRSNGEAHHLLGLVYLNKKDLYNAALEFQLAAKLLPGRAEPLYNLGVVVERGGKLVLARKYYKKALKLKPDHLYATENLARVRIKSGYRDSETLDLIDRSLAREVRPEWTRWLQHEQLGLRRSLSRSDDYPDPKKATVDAVPLEHAPPPTKPPEE